MKENILTILLLHSLLSLTSGRNLSVISRNDCETGDFKTFFEANYLIINCPKSIKIRLPSNTKCNVEILEIRRPVYVDSSVIECCPKLRNVTFQGKSILQD